MKLTDATEPFHRVVRTLCAERAREIGESFRLGVHGLPCAESSKDSMSRSAVIGASGFALKDEQVEATVSTVGLLGGVLADLEFSVCPVGADEARDRRPDLVVWVCGDETESDERVLLAEIKSPGISVGTCAAELAGWAELDPTTTSDDRDLIRRFAAEVVGLVGRGDGGKRATPFAR